MTSTESQKPKRGIKIYALYEGETCVDVFGSFATAQKAMFNYGEPCAMLLIKESTAFTDQELEEERREAFEAGREVEIDRMGYLSSENWVKEPVYSTFESWLASRKATK